MQTIFDSAPLPAAKRHQAWQDAICEIYLPVDCTADRQSDYAGFVRELRLGAVTLTDTCGTPQTVVRQSRHIGRFAKDCYFLGLAQVGSVSVRQGGAAMTVHAGCGGLYYANEPYELRTVSKARTFWLELPRREFASRFDGGNPPVVANLDVGRGLGRIAVELCSALAREAPGLVAEDRAELGEQLMNILALAVKGQEPAAERSVQRVRLRSLMQYIDEHLGDPDLSLGEIASRNGISLRYLHQLFRQLDVSASEWLRTRRLQRCYDLLTSPEYAARSITDIAYSMGFSSSSHFSNLFRAQFGLRPSDVRTLPMARRTPGRSTPAAKGHALAVERFA